MFVFGALEPAAALQQRAMATALWPILLLPPKRTDKDETKQRTTTKKKRRETGQQPTREEETGNKGAPQAAPSPRTQATITYASGSCSQLGSMSALSRSNACAMFRAGPVRVSGSTLSVKGLMSSCIAAATVWCIMSSLLSTYCCNFPWHCVTSKSRILSQSEPLNVWQSSNMSPVICFLNSAAWLRRS